MPLGVSSLGRLEGRVAGLAPMRWRWRWLPSPDIEAGRDAADRRRQFFRGEALLLANADEVLGAADAGTVGPHPRHAAERGGRRPAASSPTSSARGTEIVRINCAHDGPKQWARMVEHARAARTATGAAPRC